MKKKLTALLMAAAMVLSLAACGGGSKTETPAPAPAPAPAASTPAQSTPAPAEPAEEPITLNVAYLPNYASLWAVTTAMEKGYFEEAGITVKLTGFQDGPTIINAMESGTIDIGYIGQGAHKLCINGNAEIITMGHISKSDVVIGGPNVKTLEDLKGKTVAYSSGTSSEDILKLALEKAGLTMDDIKPMDMDASNIVTAMLSGGVDACSTWSPNSLKILEELGEKGTQLCNNLDFSDKSVFVSSWVVAPSYAETHQSEIQRFTKVMYKAMDYGAYDHYDEIAQYVANVTKTDYDSVYNQREDARWFTGAELAAAAADGTVEGYYQVQQKNFLASGAVEKEVPVSDYVMFDNMIEAGK